ncbi:hypothetical protein FJY69_00870 [candidate division WOR-3 bacterium]|nr:hypothetical protein [candidate division WOR-3 bacterium]
MKYTRVPIFVLTAAAVLLGQFGCSAMLKPDTKAVADQALVILKSLRGTTGSCYEPSGSRMLMGTDRVDSVYTDEIERGVRTAGWLFYDDLETPFDSTDDVLSFRGQKIYLDWSVTQNVWLSVHIWNCDRATRMAVRNVATAESSWFDLGPVNRPGGIQTGPAYWTDGSESVEMAMGIHHNETPDDWADNYSFVEFDLSDDRETSTVFFVHCDFRPNGSGSGELRENDRTGALVATFQWDDFGRGSLVVGGAIYPFEWK